MIFLLASNHSQVEAWATELWKKDAWMSALDEVSKLKFDGSGDWSRLAVTQEWDQDILLRSKDQKIETQTMEYEYMGISLHISISISKS